MENIYAVITLYNPDEMTPIKTKSVSEQVNKVFLCDNSSRDNRSMFVSIKNALYVNNMRNLGIPCAYNQALKNPNFNWKDDDIIIFFDQDSSIDNMK